MEATSMADKMTVAEACEAFIDTISVCACTAPHADWDPASLEALIAAAKREAYEEARAVVVALPTLEEIASARGGDDWAIIIEKRMVKAGLVEPSAEGGMAIGVQS